MIQECKGNKRLQTTPCFQFAMLFVWKERDTLRGGGNWFISLAVAYSMVSCSCRLMRAFFLLTRVNHFCMSLSSSWGLLPSKTNQLVTFLHQLVTIFHQLVTTFHQLDLFTSTCNNFSSTCNNFSSTCNLFTSTCNLFTSTCNLFTSTCNLFISTCNHFTSTCNLFILGNL